MGGRLRWRGETFAGLGASGLGYPWNSPESRQWVKAAGCLACCQVSPGKERGAGEEADPGLGALPARPPPIGLHLDPTWEGSGWSVRPCGGNGFPGTSFILGSLHSLGHLPEGPSLRWSLGVPSACVRGFRHGCPQVGRRQQGSPREPQVLRRSLLLYPAAASPPARQDQCRPGAEREEQRPGAGLSGCVRHGGEADAVTRGPRHLARPRVPLSPRWALLGAGAHPKQPGYRRTAGHSCPGLALHRPPPTSGGMSGLHAPGTPPGTPAFCLRLIKPGQISQHSEGPAKIWGQRPFLSSARPLLLGLSSAGPLPAAGAPPPAVPPGVRG